MAWLRTILGTPGSTVLNAPLGPYTHLTLTDATAQLLLNPGAITFPLVTDTAVLLAAIQTLTNKTLTAPTLTTPTLTNPTVSGTLTGSPTFSGTLTGGTLNPTTLQQGGTPALLDTAHLFGAVGYQRFSSGLILQWGTTSFTAAASVGWQAIPATSLPFTFPTAAFQGVANFSAAPGANGAVAAVAAVSTTQITLQVYNPTAVATAYTFAWMVTGN